VSTFNQRRKRGKKKGKKRANEFRGSEGRGETSRGKCGGEVQYKSGKEGHPKIKPNRKSAEARSQNRQTNLSQGKGGLRGAKLTNDDKKKEKLGKGAGKQ